MSILDSQPELPLTRKGDEQFDSGLDNHWNPLLRPGRFLDDRRGD
ncbi:MAG: hypothetical protein U0996_01290 [Planctomycetaceae bacterium]